MIALSVALAYLATLAALGWWLCFERDGERDASKLEAIRDEQLRLIDRVATLERIAVAMAERIRGCEVKAGIPTARRTVPSDDGTERVP